MTTYKAIVGQSIYDVCLQTYGSLDYLYKLLQDNGIESIDEPVMGGQVFQWDDSLVLDQGVNIAFAGTRFRYATDMSQNGSVFYIMENDPRRMSGDGGTYTQPKATTLYTIILNTSYTAGADGETSMQIVDVNNAPIIGFDIIQIERETKPLTAGDFTWNKSTATLTLLNGISLGKGELLSILYSKLTSP